MPDFLKHRKIPAASRTARLAPVLLAAAALAVAGCTALNQVRFTVKPSSLDYAQFRRTRVSPVNGHVETLRLDLSGSGFLELTSGRSERVSSGFWRESDSPTWQDLRKDHVMLTETEATAILQRLVDAGMFDRKRDPRKDPPPHDLAILAAIRFEKRLVLTADPAFHRIFDALLERFRH